jgi:hypothetical protein
VTSLPEFANPKLIELMIVDFASLESVPESFGTIRDLGV